MMADETPDVQAAILSMMPVWPSGVMLGTQPVNGYQLNHSAISLDVADPLAAIKGVIADHAIDWQVMALQAFRDTEPVYVGDDPDTGEPIFENRPIVFQPVLAEVLQYLIPEYDAAWNLIPPTFARLSGYYGGNAWVGV